jgi:dTDP-4-dehydrorhamnose reductase
MQRIREVQPEVQLIVTEDFGFTRGAKEMQPMCDLLNTRRWLPVDLLCGMVDERHWMFEYMRGKGIPEEDILWFLDHPCPPDVVGINYYVTSDRFLDHRMELYPADRGSAEGPFVDVEAVRVRDVPLSGFDSVLSDAWERYRIPVALSEVHLGGPTEEQIRWAVEAWQGIMTARERGASCASMTFWALLGSFYWDRLVTCDNGHYEHGVFDLRDGSAVPTELAEVVAQIAQGEAPNHPALSDEGWWRREDRFCF